MKKQIILIICLIFLIGVVSAVPSIPHAFRGTAQYTNGNSIPDGYIVTARLDNQPISTSSIIMDGKYGYDDPLLVSDIIGDGKKVYFYINEKLVKNKPIDFASRGITNLNLTVKSPPSNFVGCGDNFCDVIAKECSTCFIDCSITKTNACCGNYRCDFEIGENCYTCEFDCGECSINNDGGDSPGGRSPLGNSPIIISTEEPTQTTNEEETIGLNEKQEPKSPGITGGVIGFAKSGVGIGFGIGIVIILIGIGVILTLKRKSPKNE